jgi:hypothetical protein
VSTQSTRSVRARVRSATAESSSPPHSIRGAVLRRGVRRGPGNFAGDPSVPAHQAHGAPPGQGPLRRTPAYALTTKQQPKCRTDAEPTHRPRTDMAVRARACRHAGVSTYDGRVSADLLQRAGKPEALRHGPCRSKPGPTRQAAMAFRPRKAKHALPLRHSHLGTPT